MLLILVLLLCASPVLAGEAQAPATKPLQEIDALKLEKLELEGRLHEERWQRTKETAEMLLDLIQRRDGVEKCRLDLPKRQWVCPRGGK